MEKKFFLSIQEFYTLKDKLITTIGENKEVISN